MKRIILLFAAAVIAGQTNAADTLRVERARFAGPFVVHEPLILDSTSIDKKKYSRDNLIDTQMSLAVVKNAAETTLADNGVEKGSLNLLAFNFATAAYGKVEV